MWTVTSLAAHIRGELEMNPDAPGGAIPTRLENIIIECAKSLWDTHEWRFRRKQGTLSITAGDYDISLPSDFGRLDQRWMRQAAESDSDLTFVEDVTYFQKYADRFDRSDTNDRGRPRMACIVQDYDTSTKFVWEVFLAPVPDDSYSYLYWYLTLNPWIAATNGGTSFSNSTTPLWPEQFGEGWHLYALTRCQRAFAGSEAWKESWAAYKDWLAREIEDNDKTIVLAHDRIDDGYMDLDKVSSVWIGIEPEAF